MNSKRDLIVTSLRWVTFSLSWIGFMAAQFKGEEKEAILTCVRTMNDLIRNAGNTKNLKTSVFFDILEEASKPFYAVYVNYDKDLRWGKGFEKRRQKIVENLKIAAAFDFVISDADMKCIFEEGSPDDVDTADYQNEDFIDEDLYNTYDDY